MCISNSWFIPPPQPSSLITKILFSMSVSQSIFLLWISSFLIFYILNIRYHIFDFLYLISRWVIIPSWLSGLWRSFLCSSSVYSWHLFLIFSASVRSIPFLSFIVPIFGWNTKIPSLGISNFLEEISRLSHSIVFLYFFALITEEGDLSLLFFETLHSNGYIFPFLLCFSFLFFSQLFVRPPQTAILLFLNFFFLEMVLIPLSYTMSWTSIHSSLCTLSDLIPWIYLSLPLYNLRDLI